ncbi:MAG: hypothetical protein KA257_08920 [Opitutaceae bacterium]|nr:hypothetical protein [Opitutaceae bacterium]
MATTSYLALALTAVGFLALGLYFFVRIKGLADFLPIARTGRARVRSSGAFSASTVATSISLATLITAYFSLASYFGLWLVWTAVTAAAGMYLVYLFSDRIARKLQNYTYVPSIHEFLAHEYSAPALRPVAALLTVIGLLLLLATELLVGSNFLALIIPGAPRVLLVAGLSLVPLIYVILGGFETVIISDRIQMVFIWIMIPSFLAALGLSQDISLKDLAAAAVLKPVDGGLIWFLIGILLMNVPTHLSSITVWQRISASSDKGVLQRGLLHSSIGIFLSWTLLVVIAWAAAKTAPGAAGAEILSELLQRAAAGPLGMALVFIIIVGLYSALLSTASTFLIAVGHTFTTDVFGWERHGTATSGSAQNKLGWSRAMILVATLGACGIVEVFNRVGYKIEDIIFSIYGGALALFPPMTLALLKPTANLARLAPYALLSVVIGFSAGWVVAIYGQAHALQNLIFVSPAIGMVASFLVLLVGIFQHRKSFAEQVA